MITKKLNTAYLFQSYSFIFVPIERLSSVLHYYTFVIQILLFKLNNAH